MSFKAGLDRARRMLDQAKATSPRAPLFVTMIGDPDKVLTSRRVAAIGGDTYTADVDETTDAFHARLAKIALSRPRRTPIIVGPEA
jgi:hypothetical protein